jgi:predicted nucleic acid-binding protein
MMLVDTSAWIDYFNGHPSPQAECLARGIAGNEPILLCGEVLTEILLGLAESEAARVANLLAAFELAPYLRREDYLEAARIYRACRSKGITLRSTIDCLIAQTCIKHGYMLLAKDRDFVHIARYFPLRLWRVG